MVIVKLMGGLGNQMFQYAAARRLAHFNNTNLKIDLSWFDNICEVDSPREYALDEFAIQENFATREEVEALTVRKQGFVERLIAKVMWRKPVAAPSYIREKQFHFDPGILNLPDAVYLDGYWQSDKYFKDIEDVIREEFSIKAPQNGKNKKLAELISSRESVSLHVRRGDYVSNSVTNKVHGTCGLDYYTRAIAEIFSRVDDPYFFVFSDDPEWSKANLNISHPVVFVDHNNASRNYEDLRLMSQCRHHIIANSSFSWWGAWLSSYPDKIVITSKRWFSDPTVDTSDLIPPEWLKL
jgi:hypothetical protein